MNKSWPRTIPHDLDLMLKELSLRPYEPFNSDIWSVVHEWLEKYEVEAPDGLPERPELKKSNHIS
ncbi:MAG: hypothetical protein AAGH40_14830 [Verrucomicrobiota bacterium]